MTELEKIEARADQWRPFMLDEVDQAIRQGFENIEKLAKERRIGRIKQVCFSPLVDTANKADCSSLGL